MCDCSSNSEVSRWRIRSNDMLRCFRKCDPPVEEKNETATIREFASGTVTIKGGFRINNHDFGWTKKHFTLEDSPSPISSPIPSMSLVDSAVKAYRDSKLNPVERRLRKAGFKDDCGNWTDKAVRTFIEIQLDQNGHKALEPIAKDLLKQKAGDSEDDE